jgi:hypothetical protein
MSELYFFLSNPNYLPINKLIKGFHIPKLTNHVSPRPTKVRNIRIPQIVSPVCMSLYPLFQASNITPNQVTKEKTKIASIAVIIIQPYQTPNQVSRWRN